MHETKVIRFSRTPTEADLDQLRAAGCEIVHVSRLLPQVTVRLPHAEDPAQLRAVAEQLRALDQVAALEDDFDVRVTLAEAGPLIRIHDLWGAPAAGAVGPARQAPGSPLGAAVLADDAWQGQGVRVGILDTGIDAGHPALIGRIIVSRSYVPGGTVRDGHGHGTHVAGILGQTGAADPAVLGMAPRCEFAVYKVLSDTGSGAATGIARALEDALVDGCHLVNLSLGGEAPAAAPDFLERTANAVVERGLTVVVAAGNSGPKGSKPYRETPGRAERVITVGASEKDDDVASFTSRGVTDDGRLKPNVYAPGHQIVAARASGTTMGTPLSAFLTRASGTSMATPMVTGLLAALASWDPAFADSPPGRKALLLERGVEIRAEGLRVLAPALLARPAPDPSRGVDRRPGAAPPPPPEEESPCRLEDVLTELLADPAARQFIVRRGLRVARRALAAARKE